jgi:FkbM family methyltransferase
MALVVLLVLGSVGLRLHLRHGVAPAKREEPTRIRVLDLPFTVDNEVELFATEFGRVLVRSVGDRQARSLHFHRHAHEVWLALSDAEATYSEKTRWTHTRLSSGQLLYTPPYAMHAWQGGELLVFVAAPQDDPEYIETVDPRLRDAADAVRLDLGEAAKWMLDKLEMISVTGTQKLGPFTRDAAIYVIAGRGQLRSDQVHARQLIWVAAGGSVEVIAVSPLRLLVFDPARTTVSPILKEGTKRYSQDDEELVIRDFFRDRKGGLFVDVGAGDYQRYSTTFYLEEQLEWSGVAIDALSEYADGYRQHRKRTTFVNALISDKARGPQKFYRAEGFPEVSSVSKSLAEKQAKEFSDSGVVTERTVPVSTLDAVLERLGVKEIDFLSMDIEEHEPQALAGFDIERFVPALVCIESHPAVRDAIWHYFRQHGYVRQDQYLAWDSANWYFATTSRSAPKPTSASHIVR